MTRKSLQMGILKYLLKVSVTWFQRCLNFGEKGKGVNKIKSNHFQKRNAKQSETLVYIEREG